MGYVTIWIEGEKLLEEFCLKRFKERPKFIETIGKCGDARIHMVYKEKEGKGYVCMYLLYMQHPDGNIYDIAQKERESYEEIRADRTSLLVR